MQIQLKQQEIETALVNYVRDQGINLSNKKVEVNFTAGRGASGLTAEIDIEEAAIKVPPSGEIHRTATVQDAPVEKVVEAQDPGEEEDAGPAKATVETKNAASLFG